MLEAQTLAHIMRLSRSKSFWTQGIHQIVWKVPAVCASHQNKLTAKRSGNHCKKPYRAASRRPLPAFQFLFLRKFLVLIFSVEAVDPHHGREFQGIGTGRTISTLGNFHWNLDIFFNSTKTLRIRSGTVRNTSGQSKGCYFHSKATYNLVAWSQIRMKLS